MFSLYFIGQGLEPTAVCTGWYGLWGVEVWKMANIKTEKIRGENNVREYKLKLLKRINFLIENEINEFNTTVCYCALGIAVVSIINGVLPGVNKSNAVFETAIVITICLGILIWFFCLNYVMKKNIYLKLVIEEKAK